MSKQDKSIEKLLQQNSKLTERQKRFCREYLVDLNATQAAIRARYSKKSSYSIGEENLKKPKIRNYIRGLLTLRCIRTQVTSDKVIEELRKVVFAKKDVKTRDKLKALDMLAKHVGLFDKQVREFPEILKERELPQTHPDTFSERD
ncbi:MAG: terminase small subunit, partial [Candidatus Hodarchaeota archaeon]